MKFHKKLLFFCSMSAITFGLILFLIQSFFVIIPRSNMQMQFIERSVQKRIVQLVFYLPNKKISESVVLIMEEDSPVQQITLILQKWFMMIFEEGYHDRLINLQAVLIDEVTKTCYLSFDQNPFKKESSTQARWLFMESLLATIRLQKYQIQTVCVLVNHQQIDDAYLDISIPWPIQGFMR